MGLAAGRHEEKPSTKCGEFLRRRNGLRKPEFLLSNFSEGGEKCKNQRNCEPAPGFWGFSLGFSGSEKSPGQRNSYQGGVKGGRAVVPAFRLASAITLSAKAPASLHTCVRDGTNPHAGASASWRLGVDFSKGHGPPRSIRSGSEYPVSLLYALMPLRSAVAAAGRGGSDMRCLTWL